MSAFDHVHALYTVGQVRAIDRCAIVDHHIPGLDLMQRAAAAALDRIHARWPEARRLLVVAGSGNNGGDAFLLARMATEAGIAVELVSNTHASRGADAQAARDTWMELGDVTSDPVAVARSEADVIVDGLFGTGMSRAPAGLDQALIEAMNAHPAPCLALDVPSGLDADTGSAPGVVVRAAATASFVGWKRGLFTANGRDCCGELSLDTLAIPEAAFEGVRPDVELLNPESIREIETRRSNVNKGTFGQVLVVGGDHGMAGAVRLTAEAALRTGAGKVIVATRAEHVGPINAARPELMVQGVDGPQSIAAALTAATQVALGPGLGRQAWGHALWDACIRSGKPLVLDADGLNLLASNALVLPAGSVITPHPGEAARLLGSTTEQVQADRFAAARELARRHSVVVVLKGAGSLIADPEGRMALCAQGNPGMATAGMGDVLTGIIAAWLAQGQSAWEAACLGTLVHALAGDIAAGPHPRGLLAGDLMPVLRRLVNGEIG